MGGRHHRAPGGLKVGLLVLVACGGPAGGAGSPRPAPAAPEPTAAEEEEEEDPATARKAAAVERAVNQENAAIHACWARGAADDLRLEGEVVLSVGVGETGARRTVQVVSDTTGDRVLVDCLVVLWAAHVWPAGVFDASETVQLPPFRFGAPDAQYTVSSAHVPKRPLGAEGPAAASGAQVLLHPDNSGNGAAALTLLEIAPGMVVARHRHTSAEILFVLSGGGRMRERRIRAGDAVYIAAGTAHELENDGSAALVLVQLYAPAGPERRFLGGMDPGTTPAEPREAGRLRAASAARGRAYPIPGSKGTARIVFDAASAGDDAASLVALTLDPGSEIPRRVHDGSSEYFFVLEGEGTLTVDEEQIPVATGDAIQIPSGIDHGFRAAPRGPVKAVQFYAPAGPEQRFKGEKR